MLRRSQSSWFHPKCRQMSLRSKCHRWTLLCQAMFAIFLIIVLLQPIQTTPARTLPKPYHSTSSLIDRLLVLSKQCPHANAQWAEVSSTQVLIFTIARKNTPVALFTFGEHGRELITSELALHLIESHCYKPPRMNIVLVPVANPFSRAKAEKSPCERFNRRGVDLNRNYPTSTRLISWHAEEPPGLYPLSEPETRIIDAIARALRPVVYVTVHSGDYAVLFPFDDGRKIPINPRSKILAKHLQHRCCETCRVGTARELFGYRAFGTAVDYFFEALQTPFALTVEIYGDPNADVSDCWRMFNPLSEETFNEVLRNFSGMLEAVNEGVYGGIGGRWSDWAVQDLRLQISSSYRNGVKFSDANGSSQKN